MKRPLLLVILALFCGFSQEGFRKSFDLPFQSAKFITTDNIGNLYVIADNQILKFSPSGKPLQNFSDMRQGELRSVDAGNPLKVLLFYPDMARITLLGTQFAPQSTIELRNIGIQQPVLACNSQNNGYWVFDLQDFQLKKIDLNLQLQFQSGNLLQSTGKKIVPNFMTEYNNRVYINDPVNGILVFDQFGSYFKTLPVTGLRAFQIRGNELLYLQDNNIKALELKLLNERELTLPPHRDLRTFCVSDEQFYLLTTDSLFGYSY
jgi:hypothetical protein